MCAFGFLLRRGGYKDDYLYMREQAFKSRRTLENIPSTNPNEFALNYSSANSLALVIPGSFFKDKRCSKEVSMHDIRSPLQGAISGSTASSDDPNNDEEENNPDDSQDYRIGAVNVKGSAVKKLLTDFIHEQNCGDCSHYTQEEGFCCSKALKDDKGKLNEFIYRIERL